MTATINDFFGSNFEQEVMDEVVILPIAIRNTGNGTITLPVNHSWGDFERVEFYLGINDSTYVYATDTLDAITRSEYPTTWKVSLSFAAQNVQTYRVDITATSNTQASWAGSTSASGQNAWLHHVVGYKRRIARVGLDELMSSMGLPNLVTNPDLNNPVNQRAFNGNWGSLAIGAYGYDQWVKVSNTHMGFVVEDGKYIPNKMHTLTVNNVVTKQVMSPASGHFVVAIPFATSGMYDFYAGEFKRPWHPQEDSLARCKRYFVAESGSARAWAAADQYGVTFKRYSVKDFRSVPLITKEVAGSAAPGSSISLEKTSDNLEIFLRLTNSTGVGAWCSVDKALFHIDATIPWADLSRNVIIAL